MSGLLLSSVEAAEDGRAALERTVAMGTELWLDYLDEQGLLNGPQ